MTKRRNKGPAPPESSGGLGGWYETQVIALFLVDLLTEGTVLGVRASVPSEVAVQQRANGRPLDDLVVVSTRSDGGTIRLDLQIKHQLAATRKNADFADIVLGAWETIHLAGFQEGVDRAGSAAERIGSDSIVEVRKLGDVANQCANGTAFLNNLGARLRTNRVTRDLLDAVAGILADILSRTPSPDEQHLFWRHFVLMRLETGGEGAFHRQMAITKLRNSFGDTRPILPENLLLQLEEVAREMNIRATTITRPQLITRLREQFGTHIDDRSAADRRFSVKLRMAAEADVESWRRGFDPYPIAPLFQLLDRAADEVAGSSEIDLAGLVERISSERTAVIEAEPGAGKSVSLVQIAGQILATAADMIPMICPLPRAASLSQSIFRYLEQRDSLVAEGVADISSAARSGRLILLLDGWNELSADKREWAWGQIGELQRQYPTMMLVIATRSGSPAPFGFARRYALIPFNRTRQFEFAHALLGDAGHGLLLRARSIATLRPLLSTPLLLRAILRQGAAGKLPTDRESTIAAAVAEANAVPERRQALQRVLKDVEHEVLVSIACAMMWMQTTELAQAELYGAIDDECCRLREAKRLFVGVNVADAAEVLVAHHLLVSSGSGSDRTYGFQHQLFQEWFAAWRIDDLLLQVETGAIPSDLATIVDEPFWTVALLLSAERARGSEPAVGALARLILWMLGIDPILAAEMIQRSADAVWEAINARVRAFADQWKTEDDGRASAFMLLTGKPTFASAIWAALRAERNLFFQLRRSTGVIPVSALEADWDAEFPRLPKEARRALLADLIDQGDRAALDIVVKSAAIDPEADVVRTTVDYLDYHEESEHLDRLLDVLPDPMWAAIADRSRLESAAGRHRTRWREVRSANAKAATGAARIMLAMETDAVPADEIVEETLALLDDKKRDQRIPLQEVAEHFPELLAQKLTVRVLEGRPLPYDGAGLIVGAKVEQQAELEAIALAEERYSERHSMAAFLLNEERLADLLKRLMTLADSPGGRRSKDYRAISEVLAHARLERIAPLLGSLQSKSAAQAAALADTVASWHGARRDRQSFDVPAELLPALTAQIRSWTQIVLGEMDGPRWQLECCARAIGRLRQTELIDDLVALRAADEARRKVQLEHFKASHYQSREFDEARMNYNNMYRAALVAIGGQPVIAILLDLLENFEFAVDAAAALVELTGVEAGQDREMFPASLQRLPERKAALLKRRSESASPIATKLLDMIEALIIKGDPNSVDLAARLAGPATGMHYGDRWPVFAAVLEQPVAWSTKSSLCRALAMQGETLPTEVVRSGIDAALAELAAKKWASDNDHWLVREWLQLVAFAENPLAALPDLACLPRQVTYGHQLSDLASALARTARPTAVPTLLRLKEFDPEMRSNHSWLEAFVTLRTEEAAEALLGQLLASADVKRGPSGYSVTNLLSQLFNTFPAVKEKAIAAIPASAPATAYMLADAVAGVMSEDDAIRLLEMTTDTDADPVGRAMTGSMRDFAITRRPVEGTSNLFEMEATSMARLRRRAFGLIIDQAPAARWAHRILVGIDRLRDEYGKPQDEPYHPDLGRNRAWPLIAQPFWDDL